MAIFSKKIGSHTYKVTPVKNIGRNKSVMWVASLQCKECPKVHNSTGAETEKAAARNIFTAQEGHWNVIHKKK